MCSTRHLQRNETYRNAQVLRSFNPHKITNPHREKVCHLVYRLMEAIRADKQYKGAGGILSGKRKENWSVEAHVVLQLTR